MRIYTMPNARGRRKAQFLFEVVRDLASGISTKEMSRNSTIMLISIFALKNPLSAFSSQIARFVNKTNTERNIPLSKEVQQKEACGLGK